MEPLNDVEISVLKAMHSRNLYGAKHIRLEKVMKSGFPTHLYGEEKKAIYSLIKKSLVVYAKKSKNAIKLNQTFSAEIAKILLSKRVSLQIFLFSMKLMPSADFWDAKTVLISGLKSLILAPS